MSLSAPSFPRHEPRPSARRRSRSMKPVPEPLESRLVLSVTTAPVHAAAVHDTAVPKLGVPIEVTGIDITAVTRNATSGALDLAGMATGTILGQSFTTPLSGVVTPARNAKSDPTLKLDLQPIQLSLLGLAVNTGAIDLEIDATKNGGTLGGGLADALSSATGAGETSQVTAQLNNTLNDTSTLGDLDKAFAHTTTKFLSAKTTQGTATSSVRLSLRSVNRNGRGLNVKLDDGANGPIPVQVTATTGGGMLGDSLSGISSGTGKANQAKVATALKSIATTKVPLTPTTLPGLLAGSMTTGATTTTGATATTDTTSTTSSTDTPVLTLTLNPIDLNLLGLEVQLYGQSPTSPVTVNVQAQPGSGELLGNLLTTVAGLLNVEGVSTALDTVLNNVISLANQSTLSVNGQTGSTSYTNTTTVLDAYIAPVQLNLLGAVVTTSPINLEILAHSGTGLALGNIVVNLANILNNPTGNLVKDIENGLNNLLTELNQMFPNIPSSTTPPVTTPPSGAFQFLTLTVPPIDLNLLGLIVQTSTIQVNATAQSANGNLLGNLIYDFLNTAKVSQSDLDTINGDLNGVLAKVVGVLNDTTLTLSSGAVGSLSPLLQELTSATLIDTTGAAVPPESILNLDIASTNGTPPLDVNLLGVVVTTSDIQVQLIAQDGNGDVLGNLLYNVSHLLDGGLLSVLSILQGLGA